MLCQHLHQLDWGLCILVWELEDGNEEYFGIQLFRFLPDTALALLLGMAQD